MAFRDTPLPQIGADQPSVCDHAPRVLRFQPDDRLPPSGTVITRRYKGGVVQVKVLVVAKAVTGSHCSACGRLISGFQRVRSG
jgi:hypothetical protein